MKRREVLRLLATGAAFQLAPRQLMAVLGEGRALLASQSSARTLNAHQDATVKAMAEMILPRTETPGAADVGATAFIDLVLTEWYDEADRKRFLAGIDDVDARSNSIFGKDFLDCPTIQQSQIMVDLGEKMARDLAGLDDQSVPEGDFPVDPDFYAMMRRLTLTAYYTSEAGATRELHFEIIPGQFQGCTTDQAEKEEPKQ
ncbi:MAG: gluconate 2-dehydrogenase subunit 3 family protein [Candidatus Sulfotelmatobacter sp.]